MEDAFELMNFLQDFEFKRKNFPYEEVGSVLAEITPQIFSTPEYQNHIRRRIGGTYVVPIGSVQESPPPWGNNNIFVPRATKQQINSKILKKNPSIYLSVDGGLATPAEYTINPPVIRLAGVIQSPQLKHPAVDAISTFMNVNLDYIEQPSRQMTMGEFRFMDCMIHQLFGERPECGKIGCPNEKCPLKNWNFSQYSNLSSSNSPEIIAFLDRPVCANYLRIFASSNAIQDTNVSSVYQELLHTCKKFGVPLISVKQSSNHRALLQTVIDVLAGRPWDFERSFLMEPLLDFLKNNTEIVQRFNFSKKKYGKFDLTDPSDFVRFLNSYYQSGELKYNLIDYSILKHLIQHFEYRSNGFLYHDEFLSRNFPNEDFYFFYVNYCEDWSRVEFFNATPSKAALAYYIQTAMASYYPFIIQMAHENAVMSRKLALLAYQKLNQRGLIRPTLKSISKHIL